MQPRNHDDIPPNNDNVWIPEESNDNVDNPWRAGASNDEVYSRPGPSSTINDTKTEMEIPVKVSTNHSISS